MGDFYAEQLVKKKTEVKDIVIKIGLIILTVLSFLAVFMIPFGILVPAAFIVADVFLFRLLDVEYEYLYTNGDLDIDKIMHKERRKNVFSVDVHDMEVLAPSGSAELLPYRNIKPNDFSSRIQGKELYEMILTVKGIKKRVIFEPNENLIEGIRMCVPRKVIGRS